MTSVDVRRNKNRTKKIIMRVSFRLLAVLLIMAVVISVKNAYFSKSVRKTVSAANSVKKHTPKFNKKNAIINKTIILKNQKTDDGVKVEDAFVKDGKKTAYLTFDDGPSVTVTPKILDTLKQNNVHATFFLIGKNIEESNGAAEIVHRMYDEGNAIGDHTYTHNMKLLFPGNSISVDYFMSEVDKTENIIKGILGESFFTRIIRVPGGYMSRQYYKDPNLPQFNEVLKEKNMVSLDWNAYDFDAEGKKKNYIELLNNVKKTVGNKEKVVILMHDTYGKEETAKALPLIVQYLKSQGYEFKTLK